MTLPGSWNGRSLVRFVTDANSPAEHAALNGLIVGLLPDDMAVMGSGPDNPGVLFGNVRGYPRPGGPTGTEYLITPAIPQSIVDAFNVIPGVQGWQVNGSRTQFAAVGQALILTYGVTPALALTTLQNLYAAGRSEIVFRHTNGIPINGS